ncbi:Gfo/Idh/MocA family protein [Actinomadura rudentiformis]|uniref:Gfo/Idh/MocA family oxidoreductase n=1 Tax=Actinomadura rudentiformis TaxID=359158 RepID=A0A6H9Z3G0_9ACTN|nr:Gfo/Idh/MocA family oxidoreductase [Actinomadura rudentiformis]KAB2347890.1 Gfo/Idh/MocA family oxidoreductase [Actinomadura rudentiformis]
MDQVRVGVIMNGVTGRMGTRQHLERSIIAIRDEGGLPLADGRTLVVDPILVGRDAAKLRALATRYGVHRWTTSLDEALGDPDDTIYFDSQLTSLRAEAVRKAIAAGKHVFCEKPTAGDLEEALELVRLADAAGIKHGVVQDKLFLPGIRKLKRLIDGGFFGDLLSFRLNFGYWVFEGDWQHLNRPSWNYRKEDGGGLIMDMYPHWRYVLDDVIGPVRSVLCHGQVHIPRRWDENGEEYPATAEDAAYGMFQFDNDVLAQFTTSWATRPYRDEIGEWQLDGTLGSAIAGLRDCRVQSRANTPMPVWNPDIPNPIDFRAGWAEVPDNEVFGNAFRVQWEMFLRHVVEDAEFGWDLLEGAKGVQLAELAMRSWRERRWIDVPDLEVPAS